MFYDDAFMHLALDEARLALAHDDVPVGAIVVHAPTEKIVGRGHNRREVDTDPTAHAEVLALRDAAKSIGYWRLNDCTLYATLEPCPMCAGALVNARIARLVYGCADPKAGAARTLFSLCDDPRLNHRMDVVAGVRSDECSEMLRAFFKSRRTTRDKN